MRLKDVPHGQRFQFVDALDKRAWGVLTAYGEARYDDTSYGKWVTRATSMGAFDGDMEVELVLDAERRSETMKVKTVSFRKNVTVGSYQHEHAEVCIELNEGDTFDYAMAEAKRLVSVALGTDVTEQQLQDALATVEKARRLGKV